MLIRQKLTAIIMFASAITLFLGIAVFIIWGQIDSRQRLVCDLYSHASIIGNNCKASLAFSDEKDAEQTLSTIQAKDSTVLACIYDKEGKIFVQFHKADIAEEIQPPQPQKEPTNFAQMMKRASSSSARGTTIWWGVMPRPWPAGLGFGQRCGWSS